MRNALRTLHHTGNAATNRVRCDRFLIDIHTLSQVQAIDHLGLNLWLDVLLRYVNAYVGFARVSVTHGDRPWPRPLTENIVQEKP